MTPLVNAALDAVIPPLNVAVVALIPLVRAICTPVKLLDASSAVKFPLDALVAPMGVPEMYPPLIATSVDVSEVPLIATPVIDPPVMFTLLDAKLVACSEVKSPLDAPVAPIGVLEMCPAVRPLETATVTKSALDALIPLVNCPELAAIPLVKVPLDALIPAVLENPEVRLIEVKFALDGSVSPIGVPEIVPPVTTTAVEGCVDIERNSNNALRLDALCSVT